jgi:TPR repeat protein
MIDRELLANAKAGDADTQLLLAGLYAEGQAVPQNLAEAAA